MSIIVSAKSLKYKKQLRKGNDVDQVLTANTKTNTLEL